MKGELREYQVFYMWFEEHITNVEKKQKIASLSGYLIFM